MIRDRRRAIDGILRNCSNCGGELDFRGQGKYICKKCKKVEYDDFGRVRQFIENNQKTGKEDISDYNVSLEQIANLLREGRIEISNSSNRFIHCIKCGAEIRFGKYCEKCSAELPKGTYTFNEVGESPKGKMNIIDSLRERFNMDK